MSVTSIQLAKGAPTFLKDSNGNEIRVGDILKREVTCNDDFHGNWSLYEVKLQGITPILSYLESEKGKVLPAGYLACLLADLYDTKLFLWASNTLNLSPVEQIEVIKPNP